MRIDPILQSRGPSLFSPSGAFCVVVCIRVFELRRKSGYFTSRGPSVGHIACVYLSQEYAASFSELARFVHTQITAR